MKILSFDPSGNYSEGKGTTGWCLLETKDKIADLHEIKANNYDSTEAYWQEHLDIINTINTIYQDMHVVVEGFRLYGSKAKDQINSTFETPMLIGVIRQHCYIHNIPLKVQYAVEVKTRWDEKILVNSGIIEHKNHYYLYRGKLTNGHMRDSLKHALHYMHYGMRKGVK